jgi:hypothetical protein
VNYTPESFKLWLERQGYTHVRELPDGSFAGLARLMYTTGLCVGLSADSWTSRYCFENEDEAISELEKLQGRDDVPTGWVAKRPQ